MGSAFSDLKSLVRGIPRAVNGLCVISIAVLLLKVFYLNHLPSAFAGAYEFGVLVDAVLTSVVASYVFYFLTSRVPEFERQRVFATYVSTKGEQTAGACDALLRYLGKAVGKELSVDGLKEIDLKECLSGIAPMSDAPMLMGNRPATWMELIHSESERARRNAENLQEKVQFLDAEVALCAANVIEASLFKQLEPLRGANIVGESTEFLTSTLFSFVAACRNLRNATRIFSGPFKLGRTPSASASV